MFVEYIISLPVFSITTKLYLLTAASLFLSYWATHRVVKIKEKYYKDGNEMTVFWSFIAFVFGIKAVICMVLAFGLMLQQAGISQ